MKKIRIIEKFEIIFICLIVIFLLLAVFCIIAKEHFLEVLCYYFSATFGVLAFVFYIWIYYLYDNLSENEKQKQTKEKENNLYNKALEYINNEKNGNISRFERRYGKAIYKRLIKEGYICNYPKENKWYLNK